MECASELTAVWLMYLFSLWACHFNIWHWDAELTVLTQARVQNKHCHPGSVHTPHLRFHEMTKYNRNWSRFSLSSCSATPQKNINKEHWKPFISIVTTVSAYLKTTQLPTDKCSCTINRPPTIMISCSIMTDTLSGSDSLTLPLVQGCLFILQGWKKESWEPLRIQTGRLSSRSCQAMLSDAIVSSAGLSVSQILLDSEELTREREDTNTSPIWSRKQQTGSPEAQTALSIWMDVIDPAVYLHSFTPLLKFVFFWTTGPC